MLTIYNALAKNEIFFSWFEISKRVYLSPVIFPKMSLSFIVIRYSKNFLSSLNVLWAAWKPTDVTRNCLMKNYRAFELKKLWSELRLYLPHLQNDFESLSLNSLKNIIPKVLELILFIESPIGSFIWWTIRDYRLLLRPFIIPTLQGKVAYPRAHIELNERHPTTQF